jgi:hypothetical protein
MMEVFVIQLVILLRIENSPGRKREKRDAEEQENEEDLLHIPFIGRSESTFHTSP